MSDLSQYVTPNSVPVAKLDARSAFEALAPRERLYAHHLAQACFEGSKVRASCSSAPRVLPLWVSRAFAQIVLLQTSPESPYLFELFQRIFVAQGASEVAAAAAGAGAAADDVQSFFVYAASFYANMGNYRSFGDTKILPGCSRDAFWAIVRATAAYARDREGVDALVPFCEPAFGTSPRLLQLGLGASSGVSTYFSANCEPEDAERAQRWVRRRRRAASPNIAPTARARCRGSAPGSWTPAASPRTTRACSSAWTPTAALTTVCSSLRLRRARWWRRRRRRCGGARRLRGPARLQSGLILARSHARARRLGRAACSPSWPATTRQSCVAPSPAWSAPRSTVRSRAARDA